MAKDLARRAPQNKRINEAPERISGRTFTVSNLGGEGDRTFYGSNQSDTGFHHGVGQDSQKSLGWMTATDHRGPNACAYDELQSQRHRRRPRRRISERARGTCWKTPAYCGLSFEVLREPPNGLGTAGRTRVQILWLSRGVCFPSLNRRRFLRVLSTTNSKTAASSMKHRNGVLSGILNPNGIDQIVEISDDP